ncbi:MAG: poly(A) polymerase [Desulfobacterales bacterium]|nr:poly(A) polymerase [Desulfobacterales bacterium]
MPAEDPAPRIIPRSEHPISRKNIDREALKVLYRLRDAGHIAYLVGGGVRDLYLGKKPKDFDISTDARPGQLRKLFRNSRLIGRRFRLVQIFFHGNKIIEVSTFRRRSEYDVTGNGSDEILAANNTFGSPAEDARRRDLTINALFYEIENSTIIDYIGGVEDLNRGIIRTVGDPDRRLSRDPVRMMRVIRHAARNGFQVEENTWEAIKRHRDKLNLCPVSRIRDELLKDLHGNLLRPWGKLAMDSGLLFRILPFFEPCLTTDAEAGRHRDLLGNLLGVIDRVHARQDRPLADHLLLATMFIPWADSEFDLLTVTVKGAQIHALSRMIRSRLDENLAHLSISRAIKERITQLLAHLPLFTGQPRENQPKWLQRKSYFKECIFLFQLVDEARGNGVVETDAPATLPAPPAAKKPPTRKRSARRGKRGGPGFAFSSKRGGIFGLKKGKTPKK